MNQLDSPFDLVTATSGTQTPNELVKSSSIGILHDLALWYGPWVTILTISLPPIDGFLVTPQRKVHKRDKESDFVIEVSKVAQPEDLNPQQAAFAPPD